MFSTGVCGHCGWQRQRYSTSAALHEIRIETLVFALLLALIMFRIPILNIGVERILLLIVILLKCIT